MNSYDTDHCGFQRETEAEREEREATLAGAWERDTLTTEILEDMDAEDEARATAPTYQEKMQITSEWDQR